MSFADYIELERLGDSHAEHMVDRYRDEFLISCRNAEPTPTPVMPTAYLSSCERPKLAQLVPDYVAVGITPRNAVYYVVDSHMRAAIARGKGRKAARRAEKLIYARGSKVGRDITALNAKVARNRRQWAADEAAERGTERRRFKALDNVVNFHE